MSVTDEQSVECPLCMEPLELDDINFFPCTCGYQICRFCWHRIRTDENGLCPACRKQYPEDPADFKPLTQEEIQRIKNEKRQKDMQRKQKISENRKHLGNVRVVQKNLVFVVGLSQRLADHEVLKRHEYFGKFGKIHKAVINHSTSYAGSQGPSASAYVTYFKVEDALRAIQAVNNIHVDGRTLKVSLGTTKYCSHFLKSQQCPKPECMYLHELGDDAASFTKEEMQQGKHQEYEKRLHEQLFSNGRKQTASPTASQQTANGVKESWPSLQAPAAPAAVKAEGKANAKGNSKGEKQRNKAGEEHRTKRSKEKQKNASAAGGQSSRSQNRQERDNRGDCASTPSPAGSGSGSGSGPGSSSGSGSGSACCETVAVRDGSSSPPCRRRHSANSNGAEAEAELAVVAAFGEECEVAAERTAAAADEGPGGGETPGDEGSCDYAGVEEEPLTNGAGTYGSMPSEVCYLGGDLDALRSVARSVPSSFTSPLDWQGNCHGDSEPPSHCGDWRADAAGSRAAPIKDDDLGFDPWDESSKALADLIEKESRCEGDGAAFGHRVPAQRPRSPDPSPPPPPPPPPSSSSAPHRMHVQMQMAASGLQHQHHQHHQQHVNRNVVGNHMDPHRYLVPHGVRLGAPPGFAPNHVQTFNANVPPVATHVHRPHVLQQPVSNGPNHIYCDAYTDHMSVGNHAKDARVSGRKGHDACDVKEWEDGLRALLPNVNISFGNPGYRSQAIPPQPHAVAQKDKSLGLSNLGWSPPRSKASWMSQDPAIVSSGSVADGNLLLDALRPLSSCSSPANSPANWMKSYRHHPDEVVDAPIMYNNHRFPFGSQMPRTTPTWPTPLLSHTPPPGFGNSLRSETKPQSSLQLTENLI